MTTWIRSQNREVLVSPSCIFINEKQINAVTPDCKEGEWWILGKFNTLEDTFNELDHIQRWITDGAFGVFQVRG